MRALGVGTAVVLAAGVTVVLLAWGLQRQLIYLPGGAAPDVAASGLAGAESVTLETSDGLELSAWLVPPAGGQDPAATVLVLPGNAGNRAQRAPLGQWLTAAGAEVLLVDYRGYGGNPGRPSEQGLIADARAARDWLVQDHGADPDDIAYYGESLGSGVAIHLARAHPPRALVLRSPFTSLAEVGAHHYPFLPVEQLLWDRFPIVEQIRDIEVPTLVVAGSADTIVPASQSNEVAAAAAGPTRLVEIDGAGHNDPALLDGDELAAAVTQFLRDAGLPLQPCC